MLLNRRMKVTQCLKDGYSRLLIGGLFDVEIIPRVETNSSDGKYRVVVTLTDDAKSKCDGEVKYDQAFSDIDISRSKLSTDIGTFKEAGIEVCVSLHINSVVTNEVRLMLTFEAYPIREPKSKGVKNEKK